MKKGFTLLELIVVIIIIGILATLGFTQYSRMTERSRGAEGRAVLGSIRTMAGAFFLENGSLRDAGGVLFDATDAGIGPALDQIPSACRATHYFSYGVAITTTTNPDDTLTSTATRCTAGGKPPQGLVVGDTLTLLSIFPGATGDTWGGTGGY